MLIRGVRCFVAVPSSVLERLKPVAMTAPSSVRLQTLACSLPDGPSLSTKAIAQDSGFTPAWPGKPQAMTLLGWLWLGSPFVVIAVVLHHPDLQRTVADNLPQCRAAGCVGAVMMFLGAGVVPGAFGAAMFALGTPLVGLIAFLRRDDGDDGGEEAPDQPPVDWDEFEQSFWTHVRRGRQPPRRPRSPAAR